MRRMRGRVALWTLVLAFAAGSAWANNLQITNVTVIGRNSSTAYVQFDISWENSWRHASGGDPLYFHDAAWVFFKVLPDGSNNWEHVTLEGTGTNPPGYDVGAGVPVDLVVPDERVGVFVRRSADGEGTTAVQSVRAVWNFASNSLVKTGSVKIQAFGLEMVYVAEGSFKVGSVGDATSPFYKYPTTTDSYEITNEDSITVGTTAGNLYYDLTANGGDQGGPIPAEFPKGYAAFYCMKYEITQGQWVDFFNTLTGAQKTTRDITSNVNGGKSSDLVVNRNTVAWTTGDATSTRRDRVCNYLSWADVAAFTDWAGLRPMTELEFEKACRGPLNPVADEYAWGSTNIMATTAPAISGTEDGTETVTNDTSSGGCNYVNDNHSGFGDGGSGPLRAGIFAVNGATREQAGASYWGIMELSGNVIERPVTVGHPDGRAFTGLHGDGVLTTAGESDVSNWPAPLNAATGVGWRGGAWNNAAVGLRVSQRGSAAAVLTGRSNSRGGRAVRSAP